MKWTPEDMKTLRDLYPLGGTRAVYEALKGRHSVDSIRATACKWAIACEVPSRRLHKARRLKEATCGCGG